MCPPTKELMKLTLEQKLVHGGHPVLRWMMDNIYIRNDPAGNIKRTKRNPRKRLMVPLQRLWDLIGRFVVEIQIQKVFMIPEAFYLYK